MIVIEKEKVPPYSFTQITSKHVEKILENSKFQPIAQNVQTVLFYAEKHGIYCPEIIRLPNNALRLKWTEETRYINAIFKQSAWIDFNIGSESYGKNFSIDPIAFAIEQLLIELKMFLFEGLHI